MKFRTETFLVEARGWKLNESNALQNTKIQEMCTQWYSAGVAGTLLNLQGKHFVQKLNLYLLVFLTIRIQGVIAFTSFVYA